jgi:hypothetical protein
MRGSGDGRGITVPTSSYKRVNEDGDGRGPGIRNGRRAPGHRDERVNEIDVSPSCG